MSGRFQLQARLTVVGAQGRVLRDDTVLEGGADRCALQRRASELAELGFTAWLFERDRRRPGDPMSGDGVLRLVETTTPPVSSAGRTAARPSTSSTSARTGTGHLR